MHLKTLSRSVISLAVASALTACGGGGSTLTPTDSNGTQQPSATENPVAQGPAPAGQTLTGRVADGYIRGATVCIDINENGNCDDDEPVAVTGEGGLYELLVTEGAEGKPILADVPATAIDEDDNMPIGKRMMLSAPPSKREFISPITTLVQQELENNPAVDIDEAEANVKQELGLSIEDEDASLFTDYVANGDDADTGDRAERFRHMHRTAQVVAKMMQEIQDSAESAVQEQGIDLEGDPAARKALHKAVRQEIRKLLPEIADAVSDRIIEASVDTDADNEADAFDARELAEGLIPEESIDADVIQAEKKLRRVEAVTVEAMLTDGFYWFDVECSVADYPDDNPGQSVAPEFDCAAGYTHIILDDDGEHISQTDYEYDGDTGVWVAEDSSGDDEESPDHFWQLIDGEWTSVQENAVASVEFTDDGGAIIDHGDGAMLIQAVQRSVSGQRIARHLHGLDYPWPLEARSDVLFPAESNEYLFKIKRTDSRYVMFDWSDEFDGSCAEFNNNCNIVNQVTDDGLAVIQSLDAVAGGVVLAGLVHNYSDHALNVALHAIDGEGWGKAEWFVHKRDGDHYFEESSEEHGLPVEPLPICESKDPILPPDELNPNDLLPVDGDFLPGVPQDIEKEFEKLQLLQDDALDELPASIEQGICTVPPQDILLSDLDTDLNTDREAEELLVETLDGDFTSGKAGHSYGRWRNVEIDGVSMVELTLPFAIRHNIDFDDTATIVLVEHDGYVRRGAHFSDRSVETETAYNPVAFEALLSELQQYLGHGISDASE